MATTDLIVSDLQGQTSGTGGNLIQLYEIQVSEDSWMYLANEFADEAATTKIQFKNLDNPLITNSYNVVPVLMEDIAKTVDGPLPRPSLTIANVFRSVGDLSLQGSIDLAAPSAGLKFEDLLGLKVIRRTTLKKYLINEIGSTAPGLPSIEYPKEVYYIDRLSEETNKFITFELVSAFDLEGVKLPRRNIIANACAWKYKGAGGHLSLPEKVGGCTWHNESLAHISGIRHPSFVNQDDEYIISRNEDFNDNLVGLVTDDLYRIVADEAVTRVNSDGTKTETTADSYWICIDGSSDTIPSDSNPAFRRVRVYESYYPGMTVDVYIQDRNNDYVARNADETILGVNKSVCNVWKAVYKSQDAGNHESRGPSFTKFWNSGDVCGKRLNSCITRFGVRPTGSFDIDATLIVGNVITAVAHGLQVNQLICYSERLNTPINSIVADIFYIKNVTANTFELSLEPGGTAVPLVTSTGTHTFSTGRPLGTIGQPDVMPFGGFPTSRAF